MNAFRLAMLAMLAASPVMAHPDALVHRAAVAGLLHPWLGPDHMLMMACVGMFGAVMRGRALWLLPLSFGLAMGCGYAAAMAGLQWQWSEPMVLASLCLIGTLLALRLDVPLPGLAALIGLFGLCHGLAHGTGAAMADPLSLGVGLLISTLFLQALGMALALALLQCLSGRAARLAFGSFGAASVAVTVLIAVQP